MKFIKLLLPPVLIGDGLEVDSLKTHHRRYHGSTLANYPILFEILDTKLE